MSASLSPDIEPLSGAGSDLAADGSATVIPLIRGADRHGRTGREPVVLRHRLSTGLPRPAP